jgi:uncharacterized damage-inducible protein DinB
MESHIGRMLRAMTWADAQMLGALHDDAPGKDEALPMFAHLLAAEHRWLSRLQGQEPRFSVWPTLTFSECELLAADNAAGYTDYLATLKNADLETVMRYRDSKGTEYANSVLDILTHIVIHGAYHRGQIARVIGRAGGQPMNTDYIAYVRSVELE